MRPIAIVEDLDFDYESLVRGFRKLGADPPLERFSTLEQARSLLGSDQIPGIVILDLRLSDGDGREFLSSLKSHKRLASVPVVVWSAMSDPDVIESCYRSGASSFIQKESSRDASRQAIEHFANYWLRTVKLPGSIDN